MDAMNLPLALRLPPLLGLAIVSMALTRVDGARAQARNPADPPPRTVQTLRPTMVPSPVVPVPSITPVHPVRPPAAGDARQRCIDNAHSAIRAPAQPRLAAGQRRLAEANQRELRTGARPNSAAARDAQAEQIAQQRQVGRERDRVDQQLAIATRNCTPVPGTR